VCVGTRGGELGYGSITLTCVCIVGGEKGGLAGDYGSIPSHIKAEESNESERETKKEGAIRARNDEASAFAERCSYLISLLKGVCSVPCMAGRTQGADLPRVWVCPNPCFKSELTLWEA
jgi:hypothetical protein